MYEWKGLSNRKRSKSPVEEVVLESELMQSMRDEVEEVLGTASGSDYSSPSGRWRRCWGQLAVVITAAPPVGGGGAGDS